MFEDGIEDLSRLFGIAVKPSRRIVQRMPYWKLLLMTGLALSFVGSSWLAWMAGVPWIMPARPRYRRDVVAWARRSR